MASVEVLIPISAFIGIFGVVYVFLTTRNKERMAMIEKGASAELFNKTSKGLIALKFGMLLTGVALGMLIGHVLHKYAGLDDDVAMPSMIFLFGGLALIAYYLVVKKTNRNQQGS